MEASANASTSLATSSLLERVNRLKDAVFSFWMSHGPDWLAGGFYGSLDVRGNPVEPHVKGIVQQARHLWVFSTYYHLERTEEDVRRIAQHQYSFLINKLLDPRDQLFVFLVAADGTPLDSSKNLYANWFAIFALSTYGAVFGVPEAVQQALRTFESLDRRFHDPVHGGWDESESLPVIERVSENEVAAKGFNAHMHGMEALTLLYRASGDDQVKERLLEAVQMLTTKVFQRDGRHARQQFSRDWVPIGTPCINYGHDLQTCYLLLEAIRLCQDRGAMSDLETVQATSAALEMGQTSACEGFDADNGGYYYDGLPGNGEKSCPYGVSHIWWVQAEALLALWALHQRTNDAQYLGKLEQTLLWVEQHQWDAEHGECFWGVDRADKRPRDVPQPFRTDGSVFAATMKGNPWKTSYHTGRCFMLLSAWLQGKPLFTFGPV